MRIETVTEVRTLLGESPVWDADAERLYWVDSFGRAVFAATADGRDLRRWSTPANVGSICLRRAGGAVAALRTGLHFLDFATGGCDFIVDPEADHPGNTLNDGKVDRLGRFWFGSMDVGEAGPNGSLYRLDPDLSLHRLRDGITVSNGPCWSPDNTVFYFADSATAEIEAFDFDLATGSIANPRRFLRRASGGLVDGATIDAEGYLWSAHVYGGCIARYAPDGTPDRRIELPTGAVTSVMFGGPRLDVLFVTSMATSLRQGGVTDGPAAGALFAIHDLGIAGLPEPKFAG